MLERISDAVRLIRMGRITAALRSIRSQALAAQAPHGAPAEAVVTQAIALPQEAVVLDRPQLAPRPPSTPIPPQPRPAGPRPRRRPGLREVVRDLVERARLSEPPPLPLGPDELAPGARFLEGAYADARGARRNYKVYLPAGATQGRPRPLVVMLHGCTQNSDDFARGTGMNAAADEAEAIVLYPEQTSGANPNRCWNWFRPEDQAGEAGEAALLAAMTREIVATENIDPARIFVAGLSAGGAQAMNLAARYPDLFAAVGVHSGLPAGAASDVLSAFAAMRLGAWGPAPGRPMRAIVFHGDADRTVNPANAEAVAAQATAGAGPLDLCREEGEAGGRTYSRELRRTNGGAVLCETWTIHGAGHAWSGGDPAGSFADASGPDASREMLRFFLQA